MKKVILVILSLCLVGCVSNEDFSKTCTYKIKSKDISDKYSIYITYDNNDKVKTSVITRTYLALNEDGVDTLKNIKESSVSFNKRYAGNSNIKITVSKDDNYNYQVKYYLNVLNLNDSILENFKLRKNSIKFFNKMREDNIECK
jgi:hypothetical protein